jgi:hypothetical protein
MINVGTVDITITSLTAAAASLALGVLMANQRWKDLI